jgi:tetratricopeptide (TPR) repeat protein
MGGKNSIEGHIYYPSGHPLDKRLRVEINSVQNGASSTLTSDNGTFIFRRLRDGTYYLTINPGKEYESISETVQLDSGSIRNSRGQLITLQIQLKPKVAASARPAVTNAEFVGIPQAALELYFKALVASRARDHKKAIDDLKEAISIYPEFALAFNEMGAQYMLLNQLDKAATALQSAKRLAPELFLPYLNYGYLLLQQKKYEEAQAELQLATEKNDNSVVAHLYRAKALLRLERADEAERELQRSIAIGGDESNLAHRYLGALYMERHDYPRAIDHLETYLRLTPNAQDANQIREIIKGLRVESGRK